MVGDHIFWLVFMAEIRSRHALLVRLPLFAPHITYLWLMFDIRLPSRDLIADSIEAVCNLVHFLFLDPALAHHTSLCVLYRSHWYDDENSISGSKTSAHSTPFSFFSSQAQHYDGNISLPGCDKNMPGCAIAAVRHNRPTVIVYGGTIQVGERHVDCPAMGYKKGDPVNISDAFESYGELRCLVIVIFRGFD